MLFRATLDRRTFLAVSASLTAGSCLPTLVQAALPQSPALFVCDRRFRDRLAQADVHATVTYIDGDVTALWRDQLSALWQNGTASVTGLTQPAALFCLEQLARGHGRSVASRQAVAGTDAIAWVISPVSPRGFL
jgi:hypothetical protein